MSYHLFLSYSRRDNVPRLPTGEGWVTAFKAALEARHRARSGRELRIFFDKDSIGEGRDWRREIGIGLRQSRLFLAFLSPHYVTSENCLWEWEEYLRREHSVARGDDGIMPVFFVAPDDLRIADREDIADWLREMERKYPWFKAEAVDARRAERLARPFAADLSRRNQRTPLELHPWFDEGPAILRTLDAAERSKDVKRTGRGQAGDPRTLAERLDELDRHVARRIDRLALADLAPGNMPRSHEHFVGRHRELTALHDVMMSGGPRTGGQGAGGCGMIAATFAPGGSARRRSPANTPMPTPSSSPPAARGRSAARGSRRSVRRSRASRRVRTSSVHARPASTSRRSGPCGSPSRSPSPSGPAATTGSRARKCSTTCVA